MAKTHVQYGSGVGSCTISRKARDQRLHITFKLIYTCYMPITGTGSYFYWRKYFSVAISGTLVLTDAGGNTSNNWVYAYGLLRIDLHNFIVKVCARVVKLVRHMKFKISRFIACRFDSGLGYIFLMGS